MPTRSETSSSAAVTSPARYASSVSEKTPREVMDAVRAPASPAQSAPGGRFGRGAKPPSEFSRGPALGAEYLMPAAALVALLVIWEVAVRLFRVPVFVLPAPSLVVGAVVGEFVQADKGLGYLIVVSTSFWKTPLAFAAMGILSLMGIVLFGLVALVERVVFPWHAAE